MGVVLERKSMAKQMGRPKGDRDDVSAKINRAVMAKAKLVAAHRGVTSAELLSAFLEPVVDKAYAQMLRELEGVPK